MEGNVLEIRSLKETCEIISYSLLVFILRYIRANVLYPREGVTYGNLCQLYFGGLTVEDSIDIVAISIYFVLIMTTVLMANKKSLFSIMSNDYLFLCRAGSRKRLFRIIAKDGMLRSGLILILNYISYFAVENQLPSMTDLYMIYIEFVLIYIIFLISLTAINSTGHSEVYIIVFGIYLIFIAVTGAIYDKTECLPVYWSGLLIPYFIYNYMHTLSFSYAFDGSIYKSSSYTLQGCNIMIQLCGVTLMGLAIYFICKKIYCLRK